MRVTDGSLYKRGRIYHWSYYAEGKQKTESTRMNTLRGARAYRARRLVELGARDSDGTLNPDWSTFLTLYEDWARESKRRGTVENDRKAIRALRDIVGCLRLGDVTRADVSRFRTVLRRDGHRREPMSPVTVNSYCRHLRSVYNRAIMNGWYDGTNPFAGVEMYRVTRREPVFLTRGEFLKLRRNAARVVDGDMLQVVCLAFYAGLRKGECVAARWDWVDFERKTITVRCVPGLFEPKDYEERTIPAHSELLWRLKRYGKFLDYKGFITRPGFDGWGSRYRWNPEREFNRLREAVGLNHATLHILRHTFGSHLAIQGVSIYKISKWLGHSSVDVTQRHYAGLQAYDADIERIGGSEDV